MSAILQNPHKDAPPDPGRVAAKAVVNAARELDLSQRDLARIIGVSEPSVSRMRGGAFALDGKPLELALCLIRLFRGLDAMAAGDRDTIRGWMRNPNRDLGGVPKQIIQTVQGLVETLSYVDSARAPT